MERLAEKLTVYLLKRQAVTYDNRIICNYGLQVGIEVFINIAASIALAVYLQMLSECFVFFFVFIPLRRYAGGLHLDKYWKCFLCSVGTLGVILLLVKYIKINKIFSMLGILVAVLLIYRIGPICSEERRMDSDEIIFFSRKLKIVLSIILFAAIICFLLNNEKYMFLVMCVLWLMAGTLVLTKKAVAHHESVDNCE